MKDNKTKKSGSHNKKHGYFKIYLAGLQITQTLADLMGEIPLYVEWDKLDELAPYFGIIAENLQTIRKECIKNVDIEELREITTKEKRN